MEPEPSLPPYVVELMDAEAELLGLKMAWQFWLQQRDFAEKTSVIGMDLVHEALEDVLRRRRATIARLDCAFMKMRCN